MVKTCLGSKAMDAINEVSQAHCRRLKAEPTRAVRIVATVTRKLTLARFAKQSANNRQPPELPPPPNEPPPPPNELPLDRPLE